MGSCRFQRWRLIQSQCRDDENWDETAELCCCTGTWIDLITAALLNTNCYTWTSARCCTRHQRWKLLLQDCGLLTCAPLCIPGCTKINAYHWSTLKCLQGFGDAEGSVVKAKAFGESGGQHLWWRNTFYKKLHSSVQTGLFCLNQRPIQHPHQLFYKPDEWDPNTIVGYSPRRLLDECTNKAVAGWSSFLHRNTKNVTGFCSRTD